MRLFFSFGFIHAAVGLVLGALVLWAASSRLNTDVPYRNQRNSDMAILILFAALLFISVVMRFMTQQQVLQYTLLYVGGDILRAGLCVYVAVVLAKEKIERHSPFAMPLPAGAFYLCCICSLIGGCLSLAMLGYASLTGLSQEGIYHNGFDLNLLLFRPGFWFGSFICPGIAIFMFAKRVPNIAALIAVCIVWLLAMGITEVMMLTGFWRGTGGVGFSIQEWFWLSTMLPLFIAYILNSKEFAAWRRMA